MIIERSEVEDIRKVQKWAFVFGRRKTGKTFMIKNFLKYDEYFFVKANKNIISEKDSKEINYEEFINILRRSIQENKTIVVDEFSRLGDDFLNFLHYTDKKGKLIIISSTLCLSKNLLGSRSPILGLFAEFPIGLINIKDVINSLKDQKLDKKELLEAAVFLREPAMIDYFHKTSDIRQLISEAITQSCKSIPAMIGEVFNEEQKHISSVYEGVLRAVANSKIVSTEISTYLFSKKLIKKDDSSIIQQYLKNLVEFGILKRIKVFEKNKFVYKHASPLALLFYYADEKYNFSERTFTREEMRRIVDELIPKIIEDNVREFLAEKLWLQEAICETKDYDVDACLVKFQKIDTAVEIKWKNKLELNEIKESIKKLDILKPKRKLLFVPDKNKIQKIDGIEIVDICDFI